MQRALKIFALLLFTLFGVWFAVFRTNLIAPGVQPVPISSKPYNGEHFTRYPIKPQALTGFAAQQIIHPFMAFEGGGLHGNAYNSDVHVTHGPLGNDLQILTRRVSLMPGGVCPTITFDKNGLLVAMCASFHGFEINLFEPHTLNLLATHKLVTRPSTFEALIKFNLDYIFLDTSGGSYFYLDNEDRAVLGDADQIVQRIAHRQNAQGKWEFFVADRWDMKPHAPHECLDFYNWFPHGECDPISSVMPDYQGRIWWVTRHGRVGTVNPANGQVGVHQFTNEEIQNSLSSDKDGMYVITDYALYHMIADNNGKPQVIWKETYPRSNIYHYGNINSGSGSTPTLMDTDDGHHYVAITDAGTAEDPRTGLVVYKRALQVEGARQICRIPLFTDKGSAVEISPIGWGRSIVVKNDAGYRSAFHGTSAAKIPGGIMRIDIRPDDSGCDVVWTSAERVPSMVNKLSANGLLYYYSFEQQADGENAWYFLALDFATGKPVYKQFVGAGQPFDSNWGSPAIARDGTVYMGIFKGIFALGDMKISSEEKPAQGE